MKALTFVRRVLGGLTLSVTAATAAVPLNLDGFADASGAIAIQHKGGTIDPYFTLQALLIAHENGLDVSAYGAKWINWLLPLQKPDATFDRFCRQGTEWAPCKTADADDSLLALWLKFMETMPAELKRNPAWKKSQLAAKETLARLVDPRWHVYLVSPVYQHGLFMDNLEVWSYAPARAAAEGAKLPSLSQSIQNVFWDAEGKRYLVSTQPGQKTTNHAFYPDAVAQIFPLLVNFPHIPGGQRAWYRKWIKEHRGEWLEQVKTDFAWGLVALVAWKQGDTASARCWLRATLPARHTFHWTVTDEVVLQVLSANRVSAAGPKDDCA
jgi:hypothetical protein